MQYLTTIRVIAQTTLLEAVRQKLFNFIVLLCLGALFVGEYFKDFDFGDVSRTQELAFIIDYGFGAILFFGLLLSIVASAQLFFNEIEHRTVLPILAKPIGRWQFFVGKFCGAALIMLLFTLVMTVFLVVIVYWRENQLMESHPDYFVDGRLVHYGQLLLDSALQWMRFCVLIGITLLVTSFAQTFIYTVTVSFIIMIISQLQYVAVAAYQNVEGLFVKLLIWVLSRVFPNLQVYNVGNPLAETPPIDAEVFFRLTGFTAVYAVAFVGLAVLLFSQREV